MIVRKHFCVIYFNEVLMISPLEIWYSCRFTLNQNIIWWTMNLSFLFQEKIYILDHWMAFLFHWCRINGPWVSNRINEVLMQTSISSLVFLHLFIFFVIFFSSLLQLLTLVRLLCFSIHESRSFVSVLESHLKPGPWKHQLRQFCEQPLDSLKLFIRKNPKVLPLCSLYMLIHLPKPGLHICSNMGWR